MFKKLKNNEDGIVYITVIMIITVVTILTASIMGLNITQVNSTDNEIKRIKAQTLGEGMLAYIYSYEQTQVNQPMQSSFSSSYNLNETYSVSGTMQPTIATYNQPNNLVINVTY